MPQLSPPIVTVRSSFLAAMAEFRAEGRGDPDDESMIGHEFRRFGGSWSTSDGFASYVDSMRADALEDTPRAEGWVPSTTLWFVDGSQYLGRLAIRHRLTDKLLQGGGHIGYDVRPSARRRGYATVMLAQSLPIANRLGIDPALVTCDGTNVASRKVIERNGGVFDDEREGKLRFWVPTLNGAR